MFIMTEYNFKIDENLAGKRLDKALSEVTDFSRSRVQELISRGMVYINSKPAGSNRYLLTEGDQVDINDKATEVFEQKLEPNNNIPLDIVYEDEDLMVINKQAGLTVHPGAGNYQDTLVNALLYLRPGQMSNLGGADRPGIVHRLDKDTSGLILIAKNDKAHAFLAEQLSSRTLSRDYQALIWGMPTLPSGIIEKNMIRSNKDRKLMTTCEAGGKEAVTLYSLKSIYLRGAMSLIECKLQTGRTHQIRVHMEYINHPIFGDQSYGNNMRKFNGLPKDLKEELAFFKRQALHASRIKFIHPNGEEMEFSADLPEDFAKLLNIIENYKPLERY